MGLGKTLDCVCLMVESLARCPRRAPAAGGDGGEGGGTPMLNLVVTPLQLLEQWRDEILRHTDAPEGAVLTYHGAGRRAALERFVAEARGFVVLTTFDVVRVEFGAAQRARRAAEGGAGAGAGAGALLGIEWFRIVLDEAHRIRAAGSATARAVCALRGRRRWCVTGTPFNNGVGDLEALSRFIGVAPYDRGGWWRRHGRDAGALREWRHALVLMRDKSVLALPPCETHTVHVELGEDEGMLYRRLFADALEQYARFRHARSAWERSRMFGTVLSWLVRLRQACDHPLLLLGRAWTRPCARGLEAGAPRTACCRCRASLRAAGAARRMACGHLACARCAAGPQCALCALAAPWLRPGGGGGGEAGVGDTPRSRKRKRQSGGGSDAPEEDAAAAKRRRQGTEQPGLRRSSAKLSSVVDYCAQVLAADPDAKVVVYSQWAGCLDLLEHFLAARGMDNYLRFDGDVVGSERRARVLRAFADARAGSPRLLLATLQSGGTGLNLHAANHVVLVDAWYNPFLEQQAIDRVHRIGQRRRVCVARFRVRHSIEEDIARVQQRKTALAGWALCGSAAAGARHWSGGEGGGEDRGAEAASMGLSETDVHEIFRRVARVLRVHKQGPTSGA
jgi:SNF2 family DNA or RNA helicase